MQYGHKQIMQHCTPAYVHCGRHFAALFRTLFDLRPAQEFVHLHVDVR